MSTSQDMGLKIIDDETTIVTLSKFIGLRLLGISCFVSALTTLAFYLFNN